ncbi:hypothetical protein [Sulfuricurvum sp. IAE1]|nr:hypothetical protein [Sulfuricurvum sp. IAE1]
MVRIGQYTIFPYKEKRVVYFAVMRGRNVVRAGFSSPEEAANHINSCLI